MRREQPNLAHPRSDVKGVTGQTGFESVELSEPCAVPGLTVAGVDLDRTFEGVIIDADGGGCRPPRTVYSPVMIPTLRVVLEMKRAGHA
jgi:hypothetical protein